MGLIDSYPDTYLPRDGELGYLETIAAVHASIHAGRHFTAVGYQTGASAVNVILTTPATNEYHIVAHINTTGTGSLSWSESPNYDATGETAITAYNNKRDSTQTSSMTHAIGGAYTSSGTILDRGLIGAVGLGQTVVGGADSHVNEWIGNASTSYLVRFVPAASCESVVRLTYYKKDLD